MGTKREGNFSCWLQRVRRSGEFSDLTVILSYSNAQEGVTEENNQEVEQEDAIFHLHFLPLLNECQFFKNLPPSSQCPRVVKILDLPGGPEAFAIAADFCYLIKPSYTFSNVAKVRAVAEYLGMADLLDNTKKFLYTNVFSNWRSCVSFLRDFKPVYPTVDEYVETRCIKVIGATCSKAFQDTKHVSVPIAVSTAAPNKVPGPWTGSSPCQNLKDVLLAAISIPDVYVEQLIDALVEAQINLHIKCRQARNIREWLDHMINDECKNDRARCWLVILFTRMLVKSVPEKRPWLELSSQYWCTMLEHVGVLSDIIDDSMRERLRPLKLVLEQRIGSSLHELDDYIQNYNFSSETLLSLVGHFVNLWSEEDSQMEEIAGEVDGCLWGYAESASITVETFVALADSFPPGARKCHDMLYSAVEKMLDCGQHFSSEEVQELWKLVDCSKLSPAMNERAMNNPSFLCQPHVLECILKRHNEELSTLSPDNYLDMRQILQKVIQASLKLLEENSRRSKEIVDLQRQYASLNEVKVCPIRDSKENSPDTLKLHLECESSDLDSKYPDISQQI